ncbi:arginine repressor [bacterium]|nr:arginine repressor [bacterium]
MSAALRRGLIKRLIESQDLVSQAAIVELLADRGYEVTQATVSRDLAAIGARKAGGEDGIYALSSSEDGDADLAAALGSFVEEIAVSGNLVVLKTPPGAAHLVGAAIDGSRTTGVVGTVAGDDTVLIVAEESIGGAVLAARLEATGRGQ